MKSQISYAIAGAVFAAGIGLLFQAQAETPEIVEERYALVGSSYQLDRKEHKCTFKIDTATGKSWILSAKANDPHLVWVSIPDQP